MTKRGWWLRSRNGAFELKVPIGAGNYAVATQYHEITKELDIAERLQLDLRGGSLAEALNRADITPLLLA